MLSFWYLIEPIVMEPVTDFPSGILALRDQLIINGGYQRLQSDTYTYSHVWFLYSITLIEQGRLLQDEYCVII